MAFESLLSPGWRWRWLDDPLSEFVLVAIGELDRR